MQIIIRFTLTTLLISLSITCSTALSVAAPEYREENVLTEVRKHHEELAPQLPRKFRSGNVSPQPVAARPAPTQ